MKTEIFALCDFAADYGGKLVVVGAFDTILARQMPAIHPTCCIAVRFRFEQIEQGEKRVRLSLIDQDGQALVPPIEIVINVAVPGGRSSQSTHVIANINGLRLERIGEYSVHLAVDGIEVSEIPLHVSLPMT